MAGRADKGSSAAETPPSEPEPRGWMRRIGGAARRTGKLVAIGVVALLVLLIALVLLLLYSNAALTFAIDRGLGFYNDRIAGEIRIAEVEGRLADHLALRGIVLVDAEGVEVVTVGEVRLDWRWSGLLGRALDVSSLRVAQTRVDLRGDFADLAIPGPSTPSTTIGPSLPLALQADTVELAGLELLDGEGRRLLAAVYLTAQELAWSGTDASLRITEGKGVLPGVLLDRLELGATWHDAVLRLSGEVVTDVGRVDLLGALVDVEDKSGELSLTAEVQPAHVAERWVPAQLHPWLAKLEGRPSIALHGGRGADGAATLSLSADLPGLVEARIIAGGPPLDAPDLELFGHVTVAGRALPMPELAPTGELVTVLTGSLRGGSWESFEGALRALCVGCGELGGLDLRLAGSRGPGRSAAADVRLATLGVDLEAAASLLLPPATAASSTEDGEAALHPNGETGDKGDDRPHDETRANSGDDSTADDSATGGEALRVEASGGDTLDMLDRDTGVDVAPPDRADGGPGDDVGAGAPSIQLTDARWELTVPSIAHVVAGLRPFVELPQLAGRLASSGSCEGADKLACSGVVGLGRFAGVGVQVGALRLDLSAEPLASPLRAEATIAAEELTVEAADLSLAGLEAKVALGPSDEPNTRFAVDAELDAWATRRGAGDNAQLAAQVHLGPTLRIALERLDLAYRGLDAHLRKPTEVTLSDRRYTVDELDLDLAKGRVQADGVVDRDGESDLRLELADLRLPRLAKLVPSLRGRLRGRLSADAQLRGPADDPTVEAEVSGRALGLGRGRLGDINLHASLEEGHARAELNLRGDLAKRTQAQAQAYVDLDLQRGAFTLRPGSIRAETTIEELELGRLEPWLTQIDPELKVGGKLDLKAEVSGSAASPAITIEASGRGLRARGNVIGDLDLKATLPRNGDAQLDLRLARRGGVLIVDGQVLPIRLNLVDGGLRWLPRELHQVRVEATRISLRQQLEGLNEGQLDPAEIPLSGVFDLELDVAGPMAGAMIDTLEADLRLRGHRLAAAGLELGDVDLRAHVDRDRATADLDLAGPLAEQLRLHAEAPLHIAPAEQDLRWLAEGEHILTIDGRGVDLSRLRAFSPGLDLRGLVEIDLDASASGGIPVLGGKISAHGIAYGGHRIGGVDLRLDYHDRYLRVDGQGSIGAKGGLELHALAPVRVDLRGPEAALVEGEDGNLSLRVTGIDRELIGTFYELPPELVTYLGFTLTAKAGRDGYSGGLALRGSVAHRDVGAMPIRLDAAVKPTAQRLSLDFGPLREVGDLHLEVTTQADLEALLAGRAKVPEIPIQAAIRTAGLGLGLLEPILPSALYDLQGQLQADIEADGTIAVPGIRGELALADGAVTIVPLQQRLKKIAFKVSADGKTIVADSLSASSGDGTLTGDARLQLTKDGYRAKGEISLGRFPLVRPGLPQMQIGSLIKANAKSDAKATEIDVTIARTEVSILGSVGKAADSIPTSDKVRYADDKSRDPVAEDISPPEGASAADLEVVPPAPEEEDKRTVFTVALVDPLEIVGNKLAMRWQGKVRATEEAGVREVTGQLNSKDGFIEFAGNRFTIERGVITLPEDTGEIAPFVNVVATTQVRATQVTLTVRGRLPKPELVLESSPSMSQGAILTLLLTGKEEVGDGEEGQVLAAAASLLAAFQNSELRNYVNERTGIDQIAVTFEDGANRPVLSLGKRLSDDLYVETAMRINPRRGKNRVEARIEYELAPHWTLETSFGDAAVGGVDLFWEKILGNPKNPALRKAKPKPKPKPKPEPAK